MILLIIPDRWKENKYTTRSTNRVIITNNIDYENDSHILLIYATNFLDSRTSVLQLGRGHKNYLRVLQILYPPIITGIWNDLNTWTETGRKFWNDSWDVTWLLQIGQENNPINMSTITTLKLNHNKFISYTQTNTNFSNLNRIKQETSWKTHREVMWLILLKIKL